MPVYVDPYNEREIADAIRRARLMEKVLLAVAFVLVLVAILAVGTVLV